MIVEFPNPDSLAECLIADELSRLRDEVKALRAERDALLAALRDLVQLEADGRTEYESAIPHWDAARAAIAKAEKGGGNG